MARSKAQGRKSKKSSLPENSEPDLALPPPKKSKESKRVTRELAAEAALANPPPAAADSDAPAGDITALDGDQPSKKRKADEPTIEAEGAQSEAPKVKKSKKANKAEAKASETKQPEPEAEQPVKIKKRKPTDPYTLEELPVQAQRAIQYAQTLGSPDFKFNKGRQNWLMKNYLSSEVPEEFVEDVMRYLRSIMGGSRDILIKAAREIIARPMPTPAASDAGEGEEAAATPVETSKAEVTADGETEETEEQKQVRLLTTGKERAERLLKSLSVPLS